MTRHSRARRGGVTVARRSTAWQNARAWAIRRDAGDTFGNHDTVVGASAQQAKFERPVLEGWSHIDDGNVFAAGFDDELDRFENA